MHLDACPTRYDHAVHARSVRLRRGLLFALAALITITVSTVPAHADPVLAAAGDIACPTGSPTTPTTCQQAATAAEVTAAHPDGVALLGDNQYADGTYAEFMGAGAFNDTWGQIPAPLHPAPGNHEYNTSGAAGYFQYFGALAGHRYYSFDLGAWHIVSLDSDCSAAGVCDDHNGGSVDTAQVDWLKSDLAANPNKCTLAFWHHPYASSEFIDGGAPGVKPLWDALYAAHADLVLNGHAHQYERFTPMNPDKAAVNDGLTQIIAGAGGEDHEPVAGFQTTSRFRNATDFGVLFLTLHGDSFDYSFRTIGGATLDPGSHACNQATTTTVTAAPNPATTDQAITIGADVTMTNAGTHPSGTVRFERDGTVLGSAPVDGNGHAQVSLPLPEGTSTIRAFYTGGTGAIASASAPVTETVRSPPPAPVSDPPPSSDAPADSGAPPVSTPPPAATPLPCAQDSGTTRARCNARLARTTGLAACRKRSSAAARRACTRAVAVRYAKAILAIDLGTCAKRSTRSARATCSRTAQVRYRGVVRTADLTACRAQSTSTRRKACTIRTQTAYRRALARL